MPKRDEVAQSSTYLKAIQAKLWLADPDGLGLDPQEVDLLRKAATERDLSKQDLKTFRGIAERVDQSSRELLGQQNRGQAEGKKS